MVRRAIGDALTRLRRAAVDRSPGWARRVLGPAVMYFDLLVLDHGFLRLAYDNRRRLGDTAWRSAQPDPRHIRGWARRGVRTVLNLRGRQLSGTYWLERRACAKHGLTLIDLPFRSYEAPSRDQVRRARRLFDEIEYPILIHCKSGADRTGLIATLFRVAREGASVHQARKELRLRYGHIRQSRAGILDHFLECYLEHHGREGTEFFEWVERVYDRDQVTRSFEALSWRQRFTHTRPASR
jgi:protein tyrosine phosphatase (PTP) superfamily phosphohydrolase (DUF442 family)